MIFDGTSDLKLSQAMHATSALPSIFDRVQLQLNNGKTLSLCDGAVICGCPLGIAILEAKSIFPNRPLGVILSIGLSPYQDRLAFQAVDLARVESPSLHFQRICLPRDAYKDIKLSESDAQKIANFEAKVDSYMKETLSVRMQLDVTISHLLKGPNRRHLNKLNPILSPSSCINESDEVVVGEEKTSKTQNMKSFGVKQSKSSIKNETTEHSTKGSTSSSSISMFCCR